MAVDYHQELLPGAYYHIYNRAVAGESIFSTKWAVESFLKRWTTYLYPYTDGIAYCLMPNHFHFMLRVKPEEEWKKQDLLQENTILSLKVADDQNLYNKFLVHQLTRALGGFCTSYNQRKKRHGALLQARVKRICLRTESRWWWQLCYVHHNCIHHGFAPEYDLWPHSSYHEYLVRDWSNLPDYLQWLGSDGESAKRRFFLAHERFKDQWAKGILERDTDIEPED